MKHYTESIGQDDRKDNSKKRASICDTSAEVNCSERLFAGISVIPFALSTVYKQCGLVLLLALAVTTALLGVVPAAAVFCGKMVLNAVIVAVNKATGSLNPLLLAIGFQMLVLIGGDLLGHLNLFLNYLLGRRLSLIMNAKLIETVSKLDYAFFEDPEFYNTLTRAQRESASRPLGLIQKLAEIIRAAITFISMAAVAASFSWVLLAVMFAVSLPLLIVQIKYGQKKYVLELSRTDDLRMSGYLASILTTREYLPEIMSFGLWGHLSAKWRGAADRFFLQDVRLYKNKTIAYCASGILITSCSVAVTVWIVRYGNGLTVGDVMMYCGAFAGGLSGFRCAFVSIAGMYEDTLFLQDMDRITRIKGTIETGAPGRPVPRVIESIEFRNVSFRYPQSEKYALENVSITFCRSQCTLLLGSNGAGKTTFIKLLTRLYDPTSGLILLNGTDIRQFDPVSLRRAVGVIFQDFIRYAFAAKDNIACGSIDQLGNIEKVNSAAGRSKADLFIERLPDKYGTILSKLFKNGHELSLGQWQRVCLARLFIKDAPVFILDEPTASVDVETEAHILGQLSEVSENKICILISHRMFRREITDRIAVLDQGRILEQGSYQELIARDGEFARLSRIYTDVLKD